MINDIDIDMIRYGQYLEDEEVVLISGKNPHNLIAKNSGMIIHNAAIKPLSVCSLILIPI